MKPRVTYFVLVPLLLFAMGEISISHANRTFRWKRTGAHTLFPKKCISSEALCRSIPATKLILRIYFYEKADACFKQRSYWVYASRRLVHTGMLHGTDPVTVEIEVPPGTHQIGILVQRWPLNDQDIVYPFSNAYGPAVDFEAGKVRNYGLEVNLGQHSSPPIPLTYNNLDDALEGLRKNIRQNGEELHNDEIYSAFVGQLGARKLNRGEYLYLDILGGREFDTEQIRLLADYLRRRYWGWFVFPRQPMLPVSLSDLTQRQKNRYLELLGVIDGSIRSIKEVSNNVLKKFP